MYLKIPIIPMSNEDKVAFEILRSIRRIFRKTSEYSRQLNRRSGMSVPHYLCLKAIADPKTDSEVRVATVSKAVQLSPATVSRILDRLEEAGLISRERSIVDRRKVFLSVTEKGLARLASLPTPLHERFLIRVMALKKSERLKLLHSLQTIVDLMEASDMDASPLLTPEHDVKSIPIHSDDD